MLFHFVPLLFLLFMSIFVFYFLRRPVANCFVSEYDPNPLLSLSKRRRRASTSVSTEEKAPKTPQMTFHLQQLVTSAPHVDQDVEKENKDVNKAFAVEATRKEKKRLKKKKRQKMKHELLHHEDKKKKKKHKCEICAEDNCEHRKHKKRRKHRKHHEKDKEVSWIVF